MSLEGAETMGMTKERWAVLEDLLNVLVMKERTPAKVMIALDKMTDILPIEKLLMTYALTYSWREKMYSPAAGKVILIPKYALS